MSKILEELDRLAAEKVMGWTYDEDEGEYSDGCHSDELNTSQHVEWWRPTRDIAQAWECWQKIIEFGDFCCCSISYPAGEGWEVTLTKTLSDEHKPMIIVGGNGRYENAAEAIVRACLLARGVEI